MTEKNLRSGYTTGTCASAAAKAAALFLLCGSSPDEVEIVLPGGTVAVIPVKQAKIQTQIQNQAQAQTESQIRSYAKSQRTGKNVEGDVEFASRVSYCVQKDAGDDPDVTHGAWIYAEVRRLAVSELAELKKHASGYWLPKYPNLYLTGGKGIGMVTKPGLSCPVGHYAINPVPQRMILSSVGQVFDSGAEDCCLLITIWIPAGEELAEKTFNPRLGIEGGISVLGTTGIVKPMSEEALLATIRLDIHMQTLQRGRILLMAPGNYGETFLKERFGILSGSAVLCSNFVGAAMKMAAREELDRVLFVGHIGKLVKVAAGVRNTHSRYGDGRMEEMSRLTRQVIAQRSQQPQESQQPQKLRLPQQQKLLPEYAGLAEQIAACNTTEEAIQMLKQFGMAEQVLQLAAECVKQQMEKWVGHGLQVEVVTFSSANAVFGCTAEAQNTLKLWKQQMTPQADDSADK